MFRWGIRRFSIIVAAALTLVTILTVYALPRPPWRSESNNDALFIDTFTVALLVIASLLGLAATFVTIYRKLMFDFLSPNLEPIQVFAARRPWLCMRHNMDGQDGVNLSSQLLDHTDNLLIFTQRCRRRLRLSAASIQLVCRTTRRQRQRNRVRVNTSESQRFQLPVVQVLHPNDPAESIASTPDHTILCVPFNLKALNNARGSTRSNQEPEEHQWSILYSLQYETHDRSPLPEFEGSCLIPVLDVTIPAQPPV